MKGNFNFNKQAYSRIEPLSRARRAHGQRYGSLKEISFGSSAAAWVRRRHCYGRGVQPSPGARVEQFAIGKCLKFRVGQGYSGSCVGIPKASLINVRGRESALPLTTHLSAICDA